MHCNSEVSPSMTIGYATLCPSCAAPLKSCFNCRFYDENAYHQCREGVEEAVPDKKRANFCLSFMINERTGTSAARPSGKEEALKRLKSLFNDE